MNMNALDILKALNTHMEQIIRDILKRMVPFAASRANLAEHDFEKRLRLNVNISSKINAFASPQNGWKTFSVIINNALMIFYHKMLKVYVSQLSIGDDEANAIEKPIIPFNEVVNVSKELMSAYWKGKLLAQKSFFLEEMGIGMGQLTLLSRLVRSCECFTVGHELGHAVFGIKRGYVPEYAIAKEFVNDFFDDIPDLEEKVKKLWVKPWTKEISADLIGLSLSLAQPNIDPYNSWPNYKQYLCGGAEISILLLWMLQEYYDRLHHGRKITLRSSHPYYYLRWKALNTSPEKEKFSDHVNFGKRFGLFAIRILDQIFSKIENGTYKLRQ